MVLEPFFSLTPRNPEIRTYDPVNPDVPYCVANLTINGGYAFSYYPHSLSDQYNNDEILVGFDPVPLNKQTMGYIVDDLYRHCMIRTYFVGRNVTTDNQYLLIFRLLHRRGEPTAQFFLFSTLLDTLELCEGAIEDHAILLDCPGDGEGVNLQIRLASDNAYSALGFRGVDCYLL